MMQATADCHLQNVGQQHRLVGNLLMEKNSSPIQLLEVAKSYILTPVMKDNTSQVVLVLVKVIFLKNI